MGRVPSWGGASRPLPSRTQSSLLRCVTAMLPSLHPNNTRVTYQVSELPFLHFVEMLFVGIWPGVILSSSPCYQKFASHCWHLTAKLPCHRPQPCPQVREPSTQSVWQWTVAYCSLDCASHSSTTVWLQSQAELALVKGIWVHIVS